MRHGAVRRKREQALTPQFPCVHGKSLGGALGTTGRVEPYIYIYTFGLALGRTLLGEP